jgi:hypothetical protein
VSKGHDKRFLWISWAAVGLCVVGVGAYGVIAGPSAVERTGPPDLQKVVLIGTEDGSGIRVMGGLQAGFVEISLTDAKGQSCVRIAAGANGRPHILLVDGSGRRAATIGMYSDDGLPMLSLNDPRTGEEVWSVRVTPEGGALQTLIEPGKITRPLPAPPSADQPGP